MNRKRILTWTLLVTLMLLIGACGGNGGDTDDADNTPAPEPAANDEPVAEPVVPEQPATPENGEGTLQLAGAGWEVFKNNSCINCHKIGDDGISELASNLLNVGSKMTADEIRAIIVDPATARPGVMMPPSTLSDDDLNALVEFLSNLK